MAATSAEIYFASLLNDSKRKGIVAALIKNMASMGITNPYIQAGILSVASKESNFTPRNESTYATTPVSRIRAVFGSKLATYTDAEIERLKKDDYSFFNAVYGGRFGNAANEGYKYRGRGFNQLTFKANYQNVGSKIGVDLVSNPDKVNEIDTATKVLIQYFKDSFATAQAKGILKSRYGAAHINDFKDLNTATLAAYMANAGWPSTPNPPDYTGGKQLAFDRSISFLNIVKENPVKTSIGGVVFFTGLILTIATIRNNNSNK